MICLWRYLKAQAGWSWLLPPAVAAAMVLYLVVCYPPEARHVEQLHALFEFFLPLAAAVYLAELPAFDRDEGAAEIHLSYPRWPSVRLLLAALPRIAVWAAVAGATALAVDLWYLPDGWESMGAMLWAPALALTGSALLGSALTRHQAGGLMAAILWFLVDAVIPPAKLHTWGYLFRLASPVPGVPADQILTSVWLTGLLLWTLALLLAHRREHWIR